MKKTILLSILCVLLFPLSGFTISYKYELSIATVFQNEARYLKEWVEYHRKMGVEHFWLYNNNSTDNYYEVLAPFIAEGVVELIGWSSNPKENDWKHYTYTVQVGAFNDALKRAKKVSKWLALIDTDEFILPMKEKNIVECLEKRFAKVSGLCISWVCFGTSHVEKIPENERIIDHLTMRSDFSYMKNKEIKSIVKPIYVSRCVSPHHCSYKKNHHHVNTNYKKIHQSNRKCLPDILRINHYWTRDEWFQNNIKIPRHLKWGSTLEVFLEQASHLNKVVDLEIQRKLANL